MSSPESYGSMLERRTHEFRRRFLRITSAGMGVASFVLGIFFVLVQFDPVMGTAVIFGLGFSAAGYFLAATDRYAVGAYAFCMGVAATAGFTSMLRTDEFTLRAAPGAFFGMVVLAGFLLGRRGCLIVMAFSLALLAGHYSINGYVNHLPVVDLVASGVFLAMMLTLVTVAVVLFARQAEEHQRGLRDRLNEIDAVVVHAQRIAAGDLSGEVRGDGDLAQVVRDMLRGLRQLVQQVQSAGASVSSAASQISSMATEQEHGAVKQAGAVTETKQTLERLAGSSRDIASSAQGVLSSSESTLRNNELISERIGTLTTHTRRIAEILELIKDIATKSELLALNASLEGAKAGDSGRGFSLVAGQMQRLAENVMTAVKDVRGLTSDIRDATGATVVATETGTRLATETTGVARQISLITQQQQSSTEQVTTVMEEMSRIAAEFAAGSRQTLTASRDLAGLSEQLNTTLRSFRL